MAATPTSGPSRHRFLRRPLKGSKHTGRRIGLPSLAEREGTNMQGSSVRREAGCGELLAANPARRLAARWAGRIQSRPALWMTAGLLAAALASPATADN